MGGAAINLRGCGCSGPPRLDSPQLGAVLPGIRTLRGLGDAPMACVPPGFESLVAMTCPDGALMPACGSGTCGAANKAQHDALLAKIQNFLSSFDPSSSPAPSPAGGLMDRLSSEPMLLVGVAAVTLFALSSFGGRR